LTKKPIAIFTLGPICEDDKEKTEAKEQMDNELKQFTWLQPVTTEMFGGKYDPETLRFFDKLLTKPPDNPLHNLKANDSRNWADIDKWRQQLFENHMIQNS
jgi:menaquinone-dependent protoporphyrinogen oxidase